MSSLLVGYAVQKADTGGDVLAKLVLLILADYANAEGKAWPALETLVRETGRSLASVKRARAKLADLGLIAESDDQGYTLKYRGDQRPKVYDILPMVDMPERPARAVAKTPATAAPEVRRQRNRRPDDDGSPMSPRQINDGSPVSPRSGDDGSPMHSTTAHPCTERRLTHEPQTVIEDINNKLLISKPSVEPARERADRPGDEHGTGHGTHRGQATDDTRADTTTPTDVTADPTPTPTPNADADAPDASASAAPDTSAAGTGEGIDAWRPNGESLALADELHADVDSEADRFRLRVCQSGRTPRDPDAAFRSWLRRGDGYGILVRRQPTRPCDQRPVPAPTRHTHRWDCEHVLAIMTPHEAEYDHSRDGWAPSEWMLALEAAATELNRQEAHA